MAAEHSSGGGGPGAARTVPAVPTKAASPDRRASGYHQAGRAARSSILGQSERGHADVVAESAPTILVVDDDEHIRELVCEALDFEGYEARAAGDGRAALDVLAQWRPDLILLDLNMPRMDGWMFCARQRETPEIADIPIALMSAAHNLRARPLPCEPAVILEKPFDLDHLLQSVADVLTERADQGGSGAPPTGH